MLRKWMLSNDLFIPLLLSDKDPPSISELMIMKSGEPYTPHWFTFAKRYKSLNVNHNSRKAIDYRDSRTQKENKKTSFLFIFLLHFLSGRDRTQFWIFQGQSYQEHMLTPFPFL